MRRSSSFPASCSSASVCCARSPTKILFSATELYPKEIKQHFELPEIEFQTVDIAVVAFKKSAKKLQVLIGRN